MKDKQWQIIFIFCLGLFIGTAFCMKWIETYFVQNKEVFTIIGLEITYGYQKVASILSGLDPHTKLLLRFHLIFDFCFMFGVYPGIFCLCYMAKMKTTNLYLKKILVVFAWMQIVAWGCDIFENISLLTWMNENFTIKQFSIYHIAVSLKWILALSGLLLAILCQLPVKRKIRLQ